MKFEDAPKFVRAAAAVGLGVIALGPMTAVYVGGALTEGPKSTHEHRTGADQIDASLGKTATKENVYCPSAVVVSDPDAC